MKIFILKSAEEIGIFNFGLEAIILFKRVNLPISLVTLANIFIIL